MGKFDNIDLNSIPDDEFDKLVKEELQGVYRLPEYLDGIIANNIENRFKKQEEKILQFKQEERKKVQRRFAYIAAAAIFILAPLFVFNILTSVPTSSYKIMLAQGTVEVERNSEIISLSVGDSVYEDDKLLISDGSYCTVSLNDETIISLSQMSELILNTINEKDTVLNLLRGQVISSVASLDKNEIFEIITNELTASVVGTIFLVKADEDESTVAVNKGVVDINYYDEEEALQKAVLEKSESIIVSDHSSNIIEGLEEEYIDSFDMFEVINTTILKEKLEVSIPIKNRIEKTEDISEENETTEETEYEWQINKIYNGAGSNIINIATSKYYVVAQSLNSFVCFNISGSKMWEEIYSEVDAGLFDTPAIIYGNKLYALSTKKLIIINLDNGRELIIVDIPGVLSKNSYMTVYNGIIYIPFSDGIYTLDIDYNLSDVPVITYASAVSLVKSNYYYYVTSYITKDISKYDSDYNKVWTVDLDERLFSAPILSNSIFITGYNGNIYKLDYDGNILSQANLASGFISKPVIYNDKLYILSNDGNLIEVSINNLRIIQNIKIDNDPEPEIYIYKSVVINNKYLLIGSNTGDIIIYNLDTGELEKTFNTGIAINASANFYDNKYFIGNDSGEIYLVELAEVE